MAYESIIVRGQLVQTYVPELLCKTIDQGFAREWTASFQTDKPGDLDIQQTEDIGIFVAHQSPEEQRAGSGRSAEHYQSAIRIACTSQRRTKRTCRVNCVFAEDGRIRKRNSWINGATIHAAMTIAPVPRHLPGLMKDLEQLSLRKDLDHTIRAIIQFTQLLLIHPFRDGNGRTARVLLYSDLLKGGLDAKTAAQAAVYCISERHLFRAALSHLRQENDWSTYLCFWRTLIIPPPE